MRSPAAIIRSPLSVTADPKASLCGRCVGADTAALLLEAAKRPGEGPTARTPAGTSRPAAKDAVTLALAIIAASYYVFVFFSCGASRVCIRKVMASRVLTAAQAKSPSTQTLSKMAKASRLQRSAALLARRGGRGSGNEVGGKHNCSWAASRADLARWHHAQGPG